MPLSSLSDLAVSVARRLTAFVRGELGPLVGLAMLGLMVWFLAGRGVTGRDRRWWNAVPLLVVVGLVCIAGPGRLFPKEPFEGRSLIVVSENHALTLLDVPGLVAWSWAGGLAIWLVWRRVRGKLRYRR